MKVNVCSSLCFNKGIKPIQFEDYGFLDADETAVNGVKLYCSTPDGHITEYVTSTIGTKGDWKETLGALRIGNACNMAVKLHGEDPQNGPKSENEIQHSTHCMGRTEYDKYGMTCGTSDALRYQ